MLKIFGQNIKNTVLSEKNIYIIRHGETEYNRTGYLQGATINASLNENGRAQAAAFYEAYKDIKFDKIYTSVLKRSIESVELFLLKDIPVEHYEELNEINWGVMEGKKLSPKAWIRLRRLAGYWKKGEIHKRIPGGESPKDVAERQKKVINIIFSRPEEKNILLSLHGRAMRIFICQLLDLPLSEMDRFRHSNMGLYLIRFVEGQPPRVIKSNNKEHLDGYQTYIE